MWEVEVTWRMAIALGGAARMARAALRRTRRIGFADALQALGAKRRGGPPAGPQLPLFDRDGRPVPEPAPAPAALAEDAVPLPSIEEVIRDLATKQARLSQYIESCVDAGVDVAELSRLFALHGANASRLGRLLRDRLALNGEAGDVVSEGIALALEAIERDLEATA